EPRRSAPSNPRSLGESARKISPREGRNAGADEAAPQPVDFTPASPRLPPAIGRFSPSTRRYFLSPRGEEFSTADAPAETPHEEAEHGVESAPGGEVVVAALRRHPNLLGLVGAGEERLAGGGRHDLVAPALQDQHRRAHRVDRGDRLEAIAQQQPHRN